MKPAEQMKAPGPPGSFEVFRQLWPPTVMSATLRGHRWREKHMKYEKPEISQNVNLEGELGQPIEAVRGSMMDYLPM